MTFKRLSEYFQQLEQTSSRLKITEILADLFKKCSDEEIDKICYLSLGRLVPAYEGLEFQMAEKMMTRAVAKAVGIEADKVAREYKRVGDLGVAAQVLKQLTIFRKQEKLWDLGPSFAKATEGKDLGVVRVYERLMEIAKENGPGSVERKINKMGALLEDLDKLSVRYIVRIPLGKLRLGFSEMTILDSLSWMLVGNKTLRKELEDAYNVLADIGQIAKRVKKSGGFGGIGEVGGIKPKLGTPIISALAQRLGTVEEMLGKMEENKEGVELEPKYDGERLQLHKGKFGVRIFTRNLENVTHMFPEIQEALKKEIKAKEVILDSEGVGFDPKTGNFVHFQVTMKRKRKHDIGETAKEIPFKCFIFDIMYKDGEDLIKTPFWKRRKILEKILPVANKTIILSPQIVTDNPKVIRDYHEEQTKRGLEGVMVKKINAPYDPGRRGFTWVKYKQEETKKGAGLADTIDCVVMGVYQGKGKRTSFGVGAFLVGVRKGEKLVTVSKIGTGLTDKQWREIKRKTQISKRKTKPENYEVDKNLVPDNWVEPELVVEIQADNITKSPLHSAGLALRFPRLVRFRDDKSVEQVTTLRELENLYKLQYRRKQ